MAESSLAIKREETLSKSWLWTTFFTLASMTTGLSSVCIKQLLLPIQVGIIDPVNTNTSFAIVASLGAAAGLLAAPFTGALSDRTTLRWGRRRTWIIFGLITGMAGLLIMAQSTNIPTLLIGEIITQIGVDTILSMVTAIIPDQIPLAQRPIRSAVNGMGPIVGGVLGLILVTRLTNTKAPAQGYYLLAGVSILFILLFLTVLRDKQIAREDMSSFHPGHFLAGFIRPFASTDFAYVVVSRCLVFLTFTILGSYTLFYLRQVLHLDTVVSAQGVATFQIISTLMVLVGSLVGGYFSGKIQRLKPFVVIGAFIMAVGMFVIVLVPSWPVMLIAAGIFGTGFGVYLGVDIALAVRVLPNETIDSGKDLGIIYTAIFLPLIISPIIGASILNVSHSFALLFTVAGASSILAALLILPIKSVR